MLNMAEALYAKQRRLAAVCLAQDELLEILSQTKDFRRDVA